MARNCVANGRGVVGRRVRLLSDMYNRSAVVVAVRCAEGAHYYKLRDREGRIIVYHYFETMKPPRVPKSARIPMRYLRAFVERAINPPLIEKRTRWVPAAALKFVRHDYTVKA